MGYKHKDLQVGLQAAQARGLGRFTPERAPSLDTLWTLNPETLNLKPLNPKTFNLEPLHSKP